VPGPAGLGRRAQLWTEVIAEPTVLMVGLVRAVSVTARLVTRTLDEMGEVLTSSVGADPVYVIAAG